jgi:peptidoglycan/xylan/chitin deacetylase (PgdA/CDA1 family)
MEIPNGEVKWLLSKLKPFVFTLSLSLLFLSHSSYAEEPGPAATQTTGQITLLQTSYLYKSNSTSSLTSNSLRPQKVTVIDHKDNFYKIKTWVGDYWVSPKEYINEDGVTKLRTETTLSLYETPSFDPDAQGTIAPQTVQVVKKQGSWYQIKTWIGNLWINEEDKPIPQKVAYITIDDGPSLYTSQILNILDQKKAKATFFMLAPNIQAHAAVVKRLINEGDYPALHSVTHDKHMLYDGDPLNVAHEMFQTDLILKEYTGAYTFLVRAPYGSKPYMTKEFRDGLVDYGFKMWDWSIDSNDWRYPGQGDKIVNEIKTQLAAVEEEHQPVVILLHESQTTVTVLPQIIDYLHARGYKLVAYDPHHHFENNFWHDSRL